MTSKVQNPKSIFLLMAKTKPAKIMV